MSALLLLVSSLVFGILDTAPALAAPVATTAPAVTPASVYLLTCSGGFGGRFNAAKGLRGYAGLTDTPGIITLVTPATPALTPQVTSWSMSRVTQDCSIREISAAGGTVAVWNLQRVLPGRLAISKMKAGSQTPQTISLTVSFGSITKV